MLNTLLYLSMNMAVMAVIWWSIRNDKAERNDRLSQLIGIAVSAARPRRGRPTRR